MGVRACCGMSSAPRREEGTVPPGATALQLASESCVGRGSSQASKLGSLEGRGPQPSLDAPAVSCSLA